MPRLDHRNDSQPVAVLGAGDLVSHVHRWANCSGLESYRFNLFRMDDAMQAMHELRASDLLSLVKLCQVIAFAVEDDGWIAPRERDELRELLADLDGLTRRWSQRHHV